MIADQMTRLVQRLHAELLICRSATRVLERWCGRPVSARRIGGSARPVPGQYRHHLAPGPQVHTVYRRVKLIADGHTLCEADNCYLPDRLTCEMNNSLEQSDEPFGRVIAPLAPSRIPLSTRLLSPSLQGVDAACDLERDDVPTPVLEHAALVVLPDGHPISLVNETYMASFLASRPDNAQPQDRIEVIP